MHYFYIPKFTKIKTSDLFTYIWASFTDYNQYPY